jgi:YbbR domain-containing protein
MPNLFKRVFVQNFAIKLISLLLAIGLWLVVSRDPVGEVELQVPIEFRNVPQNLEIDSASFTEAQVRVRGPGRLIHRLRATDIRAEIDLASVKPGSRTFDLTSRNVRVPSDLEVVQIIPSQFQLSFDDRMTRSVEVRPRVTGKFAEGLQIAQKIADPPSIMITGPRNRVEKVEAATTDPVDASGTMDRVTFVTQAYVPDPLIQVVHPTPVRVTVIMERSGEEKKAQ